MNLRKDDVLFDAFGIKFRKREELDLSVSQQLPTYRFLVERFYTKMLELPKTMSGKKDKVIREMTEDFRFTWIFMNIPPKTYNSCKQIITAFINTFYKLRYTTVAKQKESWNKEVADLKSKLDDGVDIRSLDKSVCECIVNEYGVEVEEEEEMLYKDNCVRESNNSCPRVQWCAGVDTAWWRSALIRRNKLEKQEMYKVRREARLAAEKAALEKLHEEASSSSCVSQGQKDGNNEETDQTDNEFVPRKIFKNCFREYQIPTTKNKDVNSKLVC